MSRSAGVAVLGAGGHGKVVVATLREVGVPIVALLDDDSEKWGCRRFGIGVSGPITRENLPAEASAVIAVGDNRKRRLIAQRLDGVDWYTAIHPSAVVHSSVRPGPGSVIFAGTVIQPDATIGRHCIVNTGATIDHDCVLGDYSHVAPGSHLAGQVRLGEGVLLGIGGSAVPGVAIGDWTIVGAGGVVVFDLPAGIRAAGVPAKPRPGSC